MECYAVKKLSNIFDDNIPKAVHEVTAAQTVQELIVSKWDVVFGKLSKHLHFGYYRKGIITIFSDNPMWVNEIDFYKKDILEKMNSLFPKPCIFQLKIMYSAHELKKKETKKTSSQKYSLEELIKMKNKRIRESGHVLCSECQKMYTSESLCIYCKNNRMLI